MQALPPALFIVMLELTVGAFLSLYVLDLRGGVTRGFVLFQGALYAAFALLTWLAMRAFGTKDLLCHVGLCQRDLDPAWLAWQAPLMVAFLVALALWNVLLWMSPAPPRKGQQAASAATEDEPGGAPARVASQRGARVVLARHVIGGLTTLLGLAAVLIVGMAYRPLANAHLGGAFVPLAFLAGTIALGSATTAMLLGHWYLNTPTASGRPLEVVTALLLGGLVAELVFAVLIGPSTAHTLPGAVTLAPGTTIHTGGTTVVISTPTQLPTQVGQTTTPAQPKVAPLDTTAMAWLQYTMGLLAPLALGAVALWLARGRSFQSATGMLYLCMAFVFIGEILARGLMLLPVL